LVELLVANADITARIILKRDVVIDDMDVIGIVVAFGNAAKIIGFEG